MSVAFLFQMGINLFLALGIFVAFRRLNKPAKDDPRLSRGLQLLQSKIAVLEDLSDRTEVQVSQLMALLEHKSKDVQTKIQQAEKQIQLIQSSMEKSREVAKIFQDKIPHQEIIERQNTVKYIQAARLAHAGRSVDEIRAQVDLPIGEIEFIAKVNRSQLMFNETNLPTWAQEELGLQAPAVTTENSYGSDVETAPQEGASTTEPIPSEMAPVDPLEAEINSSILYQSELMDKPAAAPAPEPTIRKVEFPRIGLSSALAR